MRREFGIEPEPGEPELASGLAEERRGMVDVELLIESAHTPSQVEETDPEDEGGNCFITTP